eukprot:5380416-Alexandrium_andersonii.AAC.1
MSIVPFGRGSRRSVYLPVSSLAASWRRCRRGRYCGALACTIGAAMPMLSAARVAGTRLTMLLLGVRGARA